MNKIKKYLGFLVFPLLLLMMFFPADEAHAADVTDKVKLENLKITVAATGDDSIAYHGEHETIVRLKFSGKFSFPDIQANEIKEGDYFIIKAPDNLNLEDRTMPLIDTNSNTKMGTVQVESANHRLVFTFNKAVKDKQNIRGDFNANATETVTKEEKKVTYVIPGGDSQTITFKSLKTNEAPVIDEVIHKTAWNHSAAPKIGWTVRINRSKQDLTGHTVKITDNISLGAFATYIEGSFELYEAEYETTDTNLAGLKNKIQKYEVTTDSEEYQANSDKVAYLKFVDGKRGFELLMPTNTGTKSFYLFYYTTSPADTSEVKNSAQFVLDNEPQLTWKKWGDKINTSTEVTWVMKTVKASGATVTADIAGKIKITKFDEADATVKLKDVEFEIVDKATNQLVDTVRTDANGIALSKALNDGKYIVKEKVAKVGYQLISEEFEVEMKDGKGVPLNISNKRVTVDFEATKTWVNGKATDYKEVKLGLYVHKEGQTVADAKPVTGNYTPEVTVSNGVYTYKWKTQLPGRDVDGTKLIYSVRELQDQTNLPLKEGEKVAVGDNNYIVSYNADKTQVTNTYEVPKTNVTAKKVWTGGKDSARPSLFFKLYRTLESGTEEAVTDADQKEVPKTDGAVEWSDLPATDQNGVTYTYSVKEVDKDGNLVTTVDGYTSEQTTGLTVTNKYAVKPTSASLEVTKKLTGRELKTDEFEFTLIDQDGNLKETVKNDKDGNVKFSELEFDKAGTYTYKIAEKEGAATGIKYDTKTITATVTIADNGKGVLEATVAYDDEKAFENTYTPAGTTTVTLGAKKVLEGKALEVGKYSFVLKKEDGSVVETVTNAVDGSVTFAPISYDESQVGTHKYTISEVAGTETGITYDKTVQEVEVTVEKVSATELKATASKEANDLVFTNKYTPAKTEVSVKKVWKDANNQDGKRPSSVTVKLLADGQDTGKKLELTEANGWAGSFKDLDADKGGTPIKYTVVEVTVAGYTSEVTGDAASGFTITNSYSPETVDVKATKNWDDANNQDGKRPTKITINLLADGQKVASKEVQAAADGTWTATFEKLAKYKAGKEIKYTVTEEAVAEYESTITDFTITNKYAPKAIDYKVTKVWNDANNQDGKRPESVTVQLYKKVGNADPVAVEGKKLTLTAKDKTDANTWVASFTNLPQYEAGKEIAYSIKEVDVPAGYEASVTGQVVTNTHNPETVILSGTKVWKDNNNQDGKRTTSVKIQILKGDQVVQEIEVSEKTGWNFESKALPKYENGKEIKYTVKEVAVKEYTSTVTTDKDGKYTVTNEYTPEKTSVKGKKIWNDANNKDGIRPDSIKVKLLANGKETGKTVTVTKATALSDNEWAFEFTGLDRYANGKPIEYTVKEVGTIEGYTAKEDGRNVTNTHTPEKPTPGKPNEPGKPGQKPQLPNTGEKASNATVVAGLALMAVTGGLYLASRKD